jgi:DNA repair protein RadC
VTELVDNLLAPELTDLTAVVGSVAAQALARMPGGWRRASHHELSGLGLSKRSLNAVEAMQRLVHQGFPSLPICRLVRSDDVGLVYSKRLGGLEREVMIAIALDGRSQVIAEIELSSGGLHGTAVTPPDVFRPLIRCGATSFIVLHNHPSGDPTPSADEIAMTRTLASVADIIGIQLLDHVVVSREGFRSLAHLIESRKDAYEHVAATEPDPRTH